MEKGERKKEKEKENFKFELNKKNKKIANLPSYPFDLKKKI